MKVCEKRISFVSLLFSFLKRTRKGSTPTAAQPQAQSQASSGGGFLSKLFGSGEEARRQKRAEAGTLIKPRKAPVKVEPKVFFANERTFLAWMHLSVMLAGASIAILAFAEEQNPFSQIYGVILLPVAVAFIVYAMYQCKHFCSLLESIISTSNCHLISMKSATAKMLAEPT